MTRTRWPALTGVAAALLAVVLLPVPRGVAVPAGLLLALVLPGVAAVGALVPGRLVSTVERLVLVPVLSLALLVLGGVALNAAGIPLARTSWALLSAGATALGATVAHLRRRNGARSAPAPRPLVWRRTAGRLMPLALGVVLLGGAGWISVASAHAQWSATPVTALSITSLDKATTGTRAVAVSVRGTGTYRLRVTGPDGYDTTVSMSVSGSWSTTLRVPATERITARLSRSGDPTGRDTTDDTADRTVYLDGSPALAGT